ncbi:MAG: hypothetical protein DME38_11480 [Verrucomicrobia bacterium]|nr:MAG: hypothetical protein DME38_11480 [Verrucomicrobiota bacterium]
MRDELEFRVAHASRVLVSASRRNELFHFFVSGRSTRCINRSPRLRDALASTPEACATQINARKL